MPPEQGIDPIGPNDVSVARRLLLVLLPLTMIAGALQASAVSPSHERRHELSSHPGRIDVSGAVRDLTQGSLPDLEWLERDPGLRLQRQLGDRVHRVTHAAMSDADGDGDADVAEFDYDFEEAHPTEGFTGALTVRTLDGRTGKVIGEYVHSFSAGFPYPLVTRLGARGEPGFLIITIRFLTTPSNATYTMELTALSGHGGLLWERRFVSTWTTTPLEFVGATGIAFPTGLYEALPGRAQDILVGVYDYVLPDAGPLWRMETVVISGADGSTISHDPIVARGLAPLPLPAPDLDGDDYEDVLVVATQLDERGLLARSSESGEEIWANETIRAASSSSVVSVGDVTGDGTPDMALGSPLRLIDGGKGRVLWKRPGENFPTSPGDLTGDGRRDIVALAYVFRHVRGGIFTTAIIVRGYDHQGRELYSTRLGTRADLGGGGFVFLGGFSAGDVDTDGVNDRFLYILGPATDERAVVSGRDGRLLYRSNDLSALNQALDGAGDDILRVRVGGKRLLAVEGVSGDRGTILWRTEVALRHRVDRYTGGLFPDAALISDDRCADVIVTIGDSELVVLDGVNGGVLWTRRAFAKERIVAVHSQRLAPPSGC